MAKENNEPKVVIHINGHIRKDEWFYHPATQEFVYVPMEFEAENGAQIDIKKLLRIPRYAMESLIDFLVKEHRLEGIIRTDRTEDLKIIHRLLDIADKNASKISIVTKTEELHDRTH